MSGDIVERLRQMSDGFHPDDYESLVQVFPSTLALAASEIERLRAALTGIERELRKRHRIAEGTVGQCLEVDPLADIARRALEADR